MRLIYKAVVFALATMGMMTGKQPTVEQEEVPVTYTPHGYVSPIFIPRKHTVESYRSQQRRAKKRKK